MEENEEEEEEGKKTNHEKVNDLSHKILHIIKHNDSAKVVIMTTCEDWIETSMCRFVTSSTLRSE